MSGVLAVPRIVTLEPGEVLNAVLCLGRTDYKG